MFGVLLKPTPPILTIYTHFGYTGQALPANVSSEFTNIVLTTSGFLVLFLALIYSVFISIALCCHDFKKGPLPNGCRKSCIRCLMYVGVKMYMFVCGVYSNCKEIDVDYSEYLGPNYKKE